mgnify:CR=1 FL=1
MINKVILGTEIFSNKKKFNSKKKISNFLDYSIAFGINKIDTAESYGETPHEIEKLIGQNNFSKNIEIHTKFKIHKSDEEIRKSFFKSLKSLKREYIDLVYYHSPDNDNFNNTKILDFFLEQKNKSRIKKIGLSYKHDYVKQKNFYQLRHENFKYFDSIQTVLNLYSNESQNFLIPFCRSKNIDIISRVVLAKGLLTEKYKKIEHLYENNKYDQLSKKIFNFKIKNKISSKKALSFAFKNSDYSVIAFSEKEQLNILNHV